MQPVANAAQAPVSGAWSISREGSAVAAIAVIEEGGNVVVDASIEGSTRARDPFRFTSLEAADVFVRDLLVSFTYLGCDVSPAH